MKLLILCTGNSCRSQMAEGFLKEFDPKIEVFSAGTDPAIEVHPNAIKVMSERGIDLANHKPEKVDAYLNETFDFVITVCGGAKESCPSFLGEVRNKIHIGFEDPAEAQGTDDEILNEFRRIRDEIEHQFFEFYKKELKTV